MAFLDVNFVGHLASLVKGLYTAHSQYLPHNATGAHNGEVAVAKAQAAVTSGVTTATAKMLPTVIAALCQNRLSVLPLTFS